MTTLMQEFMRAKRDAYLPMSEMPQSITDKRLRRIERNLRKSRNRIDELECPHREPLWPC